MFLEGIVDYWKFVVDLFGGKISREGNNGFRVDNEKWGNLYFF